jgi:DNA gyrase subunit A
MRAILADENKLFEVIKTELLEIKRKFGDERKTRLIPDMGDIDMEDLIEDEMSVITMTHLNYIKRIPLSTYKSQNRGGKGIMGMQTRDEDVVKNLFLSSNHSYLLFFTNKGKVYRIKTWEIPEAGRNAKGTPIVNVLEMTADEKITAVICARDYSDDSGYLMMITKSGIIKKTPVNMFNNIRKSGLIAVNLKDNDELISVQKTDGTMNIFVVTKFGMAIRFDENDLRSLGRTATGVKAINLNEGDCVIGAEIISDDKKVLIVSEKGFGKCTESNSFKVQNRGGKGLKAYKITEKTGNIIGLAMVNDNEELIMVTSEGIIIRIRIRDISTVGRVAQGVKLINVGDDVTVVSMAKISEEDIEAESENIENIENIENVENNENNENNENA